MAKAQKYRASKQKYVGQNQQVIVGFETPFSRFLNPDNRWVKLADRIPWDTLVNIYQRQMGNEKTGADGINPRVAIGSMIIKHMCDLSDRETVQQIQENMYMQYFIGYSSFSDEEPFDPSLFVDFRKRLGIEQINTINEKILGLQHPGKQEDQTEGDANVPPPPRPETPIDEHPKHQGKLITDATACPQDIAYPTDLNLLSDAREKAEELIDVLYCPQLHTTKPRTYREKARKDYLRTAQKKKKLKQEVRLAVRKQLNYLGRDIKSLHTLLDAYTSIPLNRPSTNIF